MTKEEFLKINDEVEGLRIAIKVLTSAQHDKSRDLNDFVKDHCARHPEQFPCLEESDPGELIFSDVHVSTSRNLVIFQVAHYILGEPLVWQNCHFPLEELWQ